MGITAKTTEENTKAWLINNHGYSREDGWQHSQSQYAGEASVPVGTLKWWLKHSESEICHFSPMKPTLLPPQAAVRASAPRCPLTPAASDTAPLHGRTADELSRSGQQSVPRCPSPHWDPLRWSDGCGRFSVWLARNGGSGGICGTGETHRHQPEDPERSQKEQITLIWYHSYCLSLQPVTDILADKAGRRTRVCRGCCSCRTAPPQSPGLSAGTRRHSRCQEGTEKLLGCHWERQKDRRRERSDLKLQ